MRMGVRVGARPGVRWALIMGPWRSSRSALCPVDAGSLRSCHSRAGGPRGGSLGRPGRGSAGLSEQWAPSEVALPSCMDLPARAVGLGVQG